MSEFDIESFKFPDDPTGTVIKGSNLELSVDLSDYYLKSLTIFNMNKKANKITLVDSSNNIKDVPIYYHASSKTFTTSIKTDQFNLGPLRVIGQTYDISGQVIPIRQLFLVTED